MKAAQALYLYNKSIKFNHEKIKFDHKFKNYFSNCNMWGAQGPKVLSLLLKPSFEGHFEQFKYCFNS